MPRVTKRKLLFICLFMTNGLCIILYLTLNGSQLSTTALVELVSREFKATIIHGRRRTSATACDGRISLSTILCGRTSMTPVVVSHVAQQDTTTTQQHTNHPHSGVCTEPQCLNRLQSEDLKFYSSCLNNTRRLYKTLPLSKMQGSCRFIDGRKRAAVGLVSYMGSGNTWVRGLLEAATGICTGAIYCDEAIRSKGLNGEGVRSGAVLVTKTHFFDNITWTNVSTPGSVELLGQVNRYHPTYGSAILLVRNPFDAIVAEYKRYLYMYRKAATSHIIEVAQRNEFRNNIAWDKHVKRNIIQWSSYFSTWLVNGTRLGHAVHVVKYEDLKSDSLGEVKRMLDFLQFRYKEGDLRKRLANCNFDAFRRNHSNDSFDHYTSRQRRYVNQNILTTIQHLRTNHMPTLGLDKYLRHS